MPSFNEAGDFIFKNVTNPYVPQIPVVLFIAAVLGPVFAFLTMLLYLLVGFFIWPIFVFGGGFDYIQNYLFGYMLGFIFAIGIVSSILKISMNALYRTIAAIFGVLAIHICGFIYCLILAIFKVISFGLIIPILKEIFLENILYDILFSILVILIAPYIKNVLWTCMKPKFERPKKQKIKEA